MSSWRLVTKALHKAGGGPVHTKAFDTGELTYDQFWSGIDRAGKLGLIVNTVSGWPVAKRGRWALTEKGRDWCEGRLSATYIRGRVCIVATWLKALPQPGVIQLGNQ